MNMQHSTVVFTVLDKEIPLLGKVGQKKQNCQFELKFRTLTNSNIENSVVMFAFSLLDQKYPF